MTADARRHIVDDNGVELLGGIVTDTRILATYVASADDAEGANYTCASNVLNTFWDLDFTTYGNDFDFQEDPTVYNATAETTFKLGPFIYTTSNPGRSGKVSANGGEAVTVSVDASIDVKNGIGSDGMMNVYVNDKDFLDKNPNSVNSVNSDGTLIHLTSFASEINISFIYTPTSALGDAPTAVHHAFDEVSKLHTDVDFDPSFTCQVRKKPCMCRVASTITQVDDEISLNFNGKLTGIVTGHTAAQYNDVWEMTASGKITALVNTDQTLVLKLLSGTWDKNKSVEIFDPLNNPQLMYELKIVTSPGQTLTNEYSMVLADLNSTNPVNQFDFEYKRDAQWMRPQDGANGANGAKTLIYDVLNTNFQDEVGQDELILLILFISKSCGFSLALPRTKNISVSDVANQWVDIDFDVKMSRDELLTQ